MDIKWKDFVNKTGMRIGKKIFESLPFMIGIILILLGGNCFLEALSYQEFVLKIRTVRYTIRCNIFMGAGIFLIWNYILNRKYANWIPEGESFYQEWKQARTGQRRWLYIAMCIALPAAFVIDWNTFDADFVAVVTVLAQFLISHITVTRFMDKKLYVLMEQMEEVNKKSLEKALEIERQSLEKISRSDQLRIDLITNVSHDLKTPVTSMVGYLELIKKEELSDVVSDYVEVLCNKTEKLKEMINSLFSLAKVSSGNVELHMEKFEINRLLEQTLADLKDRIDESGLHFVTQFTKEDTEIVSDNMYFYRICQNLLENALKYSARNTRVFIKTFILEEDRLGIEITNTAGYHMEFAKEDILERFVRGDQARTTEGNGLGLAIVSTYAKALGGDFDIRIDCDQFKACLVFPRKK